MKNLIFSNKIKRDTNINWFLTFMFEKTLKIFEKNHFYQNHKTYYIYKTKIQIKNLLFWIKKYKISKYLRHIIENPDIFFLIYF